MRQRDYILRMIEQFAEALAKIAGAKNAGQLDEAERLIRETADAIFGPLRGMLDKVDSASAAMLLESHDKLLVYAALCAEQAELLALRGETAKSRPAYGRALELYLEAVRIAPADNSKALEAARALRSKVDETRLTARHRALLGQLG